jgi:hypothetical protein
MIISVLIKKGDSYVGKGFLEIKDEIEGIVSEDELHVYLNEKGQVEKTIVYPDGKEDTSKEEITTVGFLSQIEADGKKLTSEVDDSLYQFGNGVLATVKKVREFFQGKLRIVL